MIRVLIADDELYFRNYMLTAVDWHSLGFQVCCLAQNGEEVLFELSKNTINIVFLDINMPHINGLTLAEKIKEEYPHIMIVFITGYSDFSFTRKANLWESALVLPEPAPAMTRIYPSVAVTASVCDRFNLSRISIFVPP